MKAKYHYGSYCVVLGFNILVTYSDLNFILFTDIYFYQVDLHGIWTYNIKDHKQML